MKPTIPLFLASMIFVHTASAATLQVKQFDLSPLHNQTTISLLKAGGNLGVLTHSNDTGASTQFVFRSGELFTAGLHLANTTSSSVVYFRGFVYLKMNNQIWRTPQRTMSHWRKVKTINDSTAPIMKVDGKLAIYSSSSDAMWLSEDGVQWTLQQMTGRSVGMAPVSNSVVSHAFFHGQAYMTFSHFDGTTPTDANLFTSTNGLDWASIAPEVFDHEARIHTIGSFFIWNDAVYMLTTNTEGVTQWWKSINGSSFSPIEWTMPANTASVLYKDADTLLLATTHHDAPGGQMWQYSVGGEWVEKHDIVGDSSIGALNSNQYISGIRLKNVWYSLAEKYIPESELSDFTLLKVTKK